MPIYSRQNEYKGINAHLHSQFQRSDGLSTWSAFHASHIIHIADTLNRTLPRNYRAVPEKSLQIHAGNTYSIRPRPDVTIYSQTTTGSALSNPSLSVRPIVASTVEATFTETEPEEDVMSVVIYQSPQVEDHETLGVPVTRLELLSPANKVGGSHYKTYVNNRKLTLLGGVALIEIDYLHESASPVRGLPVYPEDDGAYPYYITITDPRFPPDHKSALTYGFGVNEAISTLNIPLAGEDFIPLGFGEVYHYTFEGGRWGDDVDYEQEPPRMESYREDDQQRIRAMMQAVATRSDS